MLIFPGFPIVVPNRSSQIPIAGLLWGPSVTMFNYSGYHLSGVRLNAVAGEARLQQAVLRREIGALFLE
jgi:hypothetical protein